MKKGSIPVFKVGDRVHYLIGGFDATICDRKVERLAHSPNVAVWKYQLDVGVIGFWYEQEFLELARVNKFRTPF